MVSEGFLVPPDATFTGVDATYRQMSDKTPYDWGRGYRETDKWKHSKSISHGKTVI